MKYKRKLLTFGLLLILAILLISALVFPKYDLIETTGEFKVATALYTYTDRNRIETYSNTSAYRKLTVAFWYPQNYDAADFHTYPLVVFSHGSFGLKTSNESSITSLPRMAMLSAQLIIRIKPYSLPTWKETKPGLIGDMCRKLLFMTPMPTSSKHLRSFKSGWTYALAILILSLIPFWRRQRTTM